MAWRSCQQYWLAQKFSDSNRQESIHHSITLEEAQTLAAEWTPRQDWDDVKDQYLQLATQAKFAENLHLQFLLAGTGDAELIYAAFNDPDWGTGPDGKGQNKLGKLLMELRQKFQEIQNNASQLQCPHTSEPTTRQVCVHLLRHAPGEGAYYRYFLNEPGYFAMICPSCYAQPEQVAVNLRRVCRQCFLDYQGKELGQLGTPQFLSRPSDLHFFHQDVVLTGLEHIEVLDLQPVEGLPGNCWLALTSEQKMVQIEFEQHRVQTIYDVPESDIDWHSIVVLHVSQNGRYAALANMRGQNGLVMDLARSRKTMTLDRGQYHVVHSHFPLAFAELDGRTILVHGTAWNRLTISDPATGEELTPRQPPLWQKGEPAPKHYLDYFHGRLLVSPDQEWIADWGWVWHPVGMIRCWSLRKWLYESVWESEDAYKGKFLCSRSYFWDGPICWADERRLVAWGYGEDEQDLIPAATICDVQKAAELSWFVGPVSSAQKVKARGINGEIEIEIPGGAFVYDEYLFSFDLQTGMTIWDIESGVRLFSDEHFCPNGYHRAHKCFVTVKGNGLFTLSRLENQIPFHK